MHCPLSSNSRTCVCMHVCIHVYMWVSRVETCDALTSLVELPHLYVCMHVCMYVCIQSRDVRCIDLSRQTPKPVCMHVCVCVCVFRMYVFIPPVSHLNLLYVSVYTYMYIHTTSKCHEITSSLSHQSQSLRYIHINTYMLWHRTYPLFIPPVSESTLSVCMHAHMHTCMHTRRASAMKLPSLYPTSLSVYSIHTCTVYTYIHSRIELRVSLSHQSFSLLSLYIYTYIYIHKCSVMKLTVSLSHQSLSRLSWSYLRPVLSNPCVSSCPIIAPTPARQVCVYVCMFKCICKHV